MSDSTYQPKIYRKQGGAEQVIADGGKQTVESGGVIEIESGGALKLDGSTVTADQLNAGITLVGIMVAGVAKADHADHRRAILDPGQQLGLHRLMRHEGPQRPKNWRTAAITSSRCASVSSG